MSRKTSPPLRALGVSLDHVRALRPNGKRLAVGLGTGAVGLGLALAGQFWGLAVSYVSIGLALDDARTYADLGNEISRLELRQQRLEMLSQRVDDILNSPGL